MTKAEIIGIILFGAVLILLLVCTSGASNDEDGSQGNTPGHSDGCAGGGHP